MDPKYPLNRVPDPASTPPATPEPKNYTEIPRSPVPQRATKPPVEMSFCEALDQVLEGKRITRLDWDTNEIFGKLEADALKIFINGEYHAWELVPGDITAKDWVVLPDLN